MGLPHSHQAVLFAMHAVAPKTWRIGAASTPVGRQRPAAAHLPHSHLSVTASAQPQQQHQPAQRQQGWQNLLLPTHQRRAETQLGAPPVKQVGKELLAHAQPAGQMRQEGAGTSVATSSGRASGAAPSTETSSSSTGGKSSGHLSTRDRQPPQLPAPWTQLSAAERRDYLIAVRDHNG